MYHISNIVTFAIISSQPAMKKLDWTHSIAYTVKLGDKERFDKEQIGVKEPIPVINLLIYFIRIRNIWALRNNLRVNKKVPYHKVWLYILQRWHLWHSYSKINKVMTKDLSKKLDIISGVSMYFTNNFWQLPSSFF